MTKQTTIVVIGALRVKEILAPVYYGSKQSTQKWWVQQHCRLGRMAILEDFDTDVQRQMTFVFVEVLRPSQHSGVMSSAVSLPNHTLTAQA